MTITHDRHAQDPTSMSDAERTTRIDLAAAYRLAAMFGWDDLIFTHMTARIPDTEHLLINPYGLLFDEITASNLVKIDLAGQILDDTPHDINPAGLTIHSAVHEAREDVQCVIHLHTTEGVAVGAQTHGVLPISQHSIFVLSSIAYHDYEGVALRDDEKQRLTSNFADNTYLMLRNHGLLTVGRSVADAWQAMYFFQKSCAIQVAATGSSADGADHLTMIDQSIIDTAGQQARTVTRGERANLVWPSLLRRVERLDPTFAV